MNKTKPRLMERVYELLCERALVMSVADIARESGCSRGQLYHILRGYTKSPNVDDMQTLYEYLSGRELEVI